MNRFVLKNTFIKNINILLCDKYFYENKKSKLNFEDREYGGTGRPHHLQLCALIAQANGGASFFRMRRIPVGAG